VIDQDVDILIVGGGLTGASLLLALNQSGYNCMLVEAQPFGNKTESDFDARSLALSPATVRILNMLSLWPLISKHATAIETIHVSNQHRFGATRLKAEKNHPLGHVVEMQYINRALHQLLPAEKILAPASLTALDHENGLATLNTSQGKRHIKARLIVAADGADSAVRCFTGLRSQSKDYQQIAIVANIELAKPHLNRAFERFTATGPLAMLPMTDQRMSLVWAMPPEEARLRLALSDKDFLGSLQQAFGYRLGRFQKAGRRHSFPLKQIIMPQQVKWPVVFVGNAARTLHPVAGQGFNLGIRDVAMLAQLINEQGLSAAMLENYAQLRKHDQSAITGMTDGLMSAFTSRLPGLNIARTLGMIAMDNTPVLKNILKRYASGFGGVVSDLACEIPLDTISGLKTKEHHETDL